MATEHWYVVAAERLMVGGYPYSKGDRIKQSDIMRRDFHRLGSWLRQGSLVHAGETPSAKLNFKGMTKQAIKEYAAEAGIDIPEDVVKVADLRDFMTEYHKEDPDGS